MLVAGALVAMPAAALVVLGALKGRHLLASVGLLLAAMAPAPSYHVATPAWPGWPSSSMLAAATSQRDRGGVPPPWRRAA